MRGRLGGVVWTDVSLGIAGILAVTLLFTAMDTTAKLLSERYEALFVVWARYAGQAAGALILFAPRLREIARTDRLGLQILRSAFLFAATVMFFTGFSLMPLADVIAIAQIAPLAITALAALVLGERVGPYRWAAVGVGFLGAMVIIQPAGAALGWAALLPLGAALAFAAFSVATRFLGPRDGAWTTFFYTGVVGMAGASLALPWVWSTPALADLPLFAALACFGASGQALLILAMRRAPASLLAPFLYAQLIWSAIAGFVVFGDAPAASTWIGATVIVAAGLFMRWRERVRARRGA